MTYSSAVANFELKTETGGAGASESRAYFYKASTLDGDLYVTG